MECSDARMDHSRRVSTTAARSLFSQAAQRPDADVYIARMQVALPSVFSPATKSLSIIVPAYNEEERLGATLTETIAYLQQRRNRQGPHFTWEIIVVDDGSRDKTVR